MWGKLFKINIMLYKGKMMFKRIIFIAVMLLSSVSGAFAADLKIGIFDERLVLSKVPQVELIEAKLQAQFKGRTDEVKTLTGKGREMQEKGQRDAITMTFEQKVKLERELGELGFSLKSKTKYFKEDYQRANQAELTKIRVKIRQIVNKIAVDENYDIILRSDAALYRKDAIDISNKVITIISNPAG